MFMSEIGRDNRTPHAVQSPTGNEPTHSEMTITDSSIKSLHEPLLFKPASARYAHVKTEDINESTNLTGSQLLVV